MFYIKDVKDFFNIGVLDSIDNSIEYYSVTQIEDFVRRGIRIAGVASDFSIFEVNEADYTKYYMGDYLGTSKYDALVLSEEEGITRSGEIPYRLGMLYRCYASVYKRYVGQTNPTSILIGGYDTKHIWYRETQDDYLYQKSRLHLQNLPAVIATETDIRRAFCIMCTPIRESYNYDKGSIIEVDAIQQPLYSYVTESGDDKAMFIRQLAYSEEQDRLWVLTDTPSMFLEDFYALFKRNKIRVHNAVLTDVGFTYWGLDGEYSVNMQLIKNLGRYVSLHSEHDMARGKLFSISNWKLQENGTLINGRVYRGQMIIPDGCTCINFDSISVTDGVPVTSISIPSSCVKSCRNEYGSWWGHSFASKYTLVCKTNATDVIFALMAKLNQVRGDTTCIFDWSNSSKATLLVGFFAYSGRTIESFEDIDAEDMLLCANFYSDYISPNLLKYSLPLDMAKLCEVTGYLRWRTTRVHLWADGFLNDTIEQLEQGGSEGVNLLAKYLRLRLDNVRHIDCLGWISCFLCLIKMSHGAYSNRFSTKEINDVLGKFWVVFTKLYETHIRRLKHMRDTKNYDSIEAALRRYY